MLEKKAYKVNFFDLIYIFYASAYCLFWASSLKEAVPFANSALCAAQYITIFALLGGYLWFCYNSGRMDVGTIACAAAVIAVCALIEWRITNREFLVTTMLFVCAKQYDIQRLLRIDIVLKLFWTAVIMLLGGLELFPNIEGVYYNGDYKMALGFQHPNTFSFFIYIILLEWLIIEYDHLKIWHFVVVAICARLVMQIAHAKTTEYTFLAILFCIILDKLKPAIFKNKFVRFFLSMVPIALGALSILLTVLYVQRNKIALTLNPMLSGRLYLQSEYWKHFDLSLFGNDIDAFAEKFFLDSGYMKALIQFGIVFFVVLCVGYARRIYQLLKEGSHEIAFLCLFFVVYGFAETSLLRPVINITLIFLIFGFGKTLKASEEQKRQGEIR